MTKRRLTEKISPLWLGIGISGSFLMVLLISETVLGRWDEILIGGEFNALANVSDGVLRDVRLAFVHCLVIGYLPAAFLHVLQSGRRTVLVLQEALDCTPLECERLAASVRLSTSGLFIIGLIALALSFATPYLVPPVPPTPWNPSSWSPEVAWHRVLGPATMIWAWWLAYAIVTVSLRMTSIAKKLNKIDLFKLSPLTPFTQQGLTNALLLIGAFSIWSLMLLETGFGQMMLVVGGVNFALAGIAFLSPVYSVHKRIRQSKNEVLERINGEISKQRCSFQNADFTQHSGQFADLIAYQGLIKGIPEWPFTTSTYARIVLYTFLPLLTWGVGIVAEEIISRVFL